MERLTDDSWSSMDRCDVCAAGEDAIAAFSYTPPSYGTRDHYGVPLEPDFPAEVEIYLFNPDGTRNEDLEDEADMAAVEQQVWDYLNDARQAAEEDIAADRAYWSQFDD